MAQLPRQGLRFAVVGVMSTGVHVLVASSLIELANFHAGAANGTAFTIATLTSYLINGKWTFEAQLGAMQLTRFIIVASVGLATTVAITTAIQRAGYHYLVGIAAVVLFIPVLTFFSHRLWTYRVS